jgi:hypothetical protein
LPIAAGLRQYLMLKSQYHQVSDMKINLDTLQFNFKHKPLLIGGKAMEYYGIRPAGADIDFVVSADDHKRLTAQYPDHIKDIYGDIGVIEYEFEIWNTICTFDYDSLKVAAIEENAYLVVSIEKLLMLKAIAMKADEKYRRDVELIADYILDTAYGKR